MTENVPGEQRKRESKWHLLDTGDWDPEYRVASDESRDTSRNQDIMSLTSHARRSGLYLEGVGASGSL